MRTLSGACALLILVCGCAEPRPPLGGPTDKTPPSLEASEPANESVQVRPESIRLTFSEYVDEGSFVQAFSITPAPEGRPRLRWKGHSVTIRFEEEWRDETTYVITLDTRLRDTRGVTLLQPIVVAFSTGDVIDQGRIQGRVVEALRGEPAGNLSILAFMVENASYDPGLEPSYVTTTGEDGHFDFSYLREADYFVLALEDLNRNRRPDLAERFAVPPQPALRATPDMTMPRPVWVVGAVDTLAPSISRVRALSSSRLAVRFSEAIVMPERNPDFWTLGDSATGHARTILDVFGRSEDPQTLYLRTDSLDERGWFLRPDPDVADSSGNPVQNEPIHFEGRSRQDTTQLRFVGFLPEESDAEVALSPREFIGLEFNEPVKDTLLKQLVQVTDSLSNELIIDAKTQNGTTYTLSAPYSPGDRARVVINLAGDRYEQSFLRLTERELGSLSGVTLPGGDSVRVELFSTSPGSIYDYAAANEDGTFIFEGLPEKDFEIRAFIDRNGNSRWDGGVIYPYRPAEPIIWLEEPLTVRPRWDTAPSDTLRLVPAAPDSTGAH